MWIVEDEKCMVVHLWLRYSENWIDLDLDGSQDGKYGSYIRSQSIKWLIMDLLWNRRQ